jgi:hypothetical protein
VPVEGEMPGRTMRLIRRLCLFLLCVAAGCTTVWTRTGARPNIVVLEAELRVGESTKADARYFLGEPYGQGRDMLPTLSVARSTWVYYYAEESGSANEYVVLLVFFDGDRYDGYMWYSSLPEFPLNEGPPRPG